LKERPDTLTHLTPSIHPIISDGPPLSRTILSLSAHSFDELSWAAGDTTFFTDEASSSDFYTTHGVLLYGGLDWTNLQVKSNASSMWSPNGQVRKHEREDSVCVCARVARGENEERESTRLIPSLFIIPL